MRAYKVEILIVDHDAVGDEIATVLENANYPNDCIYPRVMRVHSVEIGEWDDSHPLNHRDKAPAEYERLFGGAAVVEPPLRSFADALDDALSVAASTVSNESHLSTRNTRRWADCAHCGGTGEVDDGELTHHEGTNIPFACGPIKCTKDCPKCGGHPW